jgi:phage shock protein PspC (stress-responsive transcriptional regulator)
MKAIVTLNLCDTEFQLEDDASAKLRRYIAAFEAAFTDSRRAAQREELDRMLKERLASRLKRNKTTLVEADIEAVLIELPAVGTPMPAKRRLFRIRQGRDIAGVCLGVAAYSQLDVGLVRSIFVLAAGVSIIFYLIAMFVVPVVETVEQAKLASASS